MSAKTAITVLGARAEVERAWQGSPHRPDVEGVSFKDAPGDRGTEIHVTVDQRGTLGQIAGKLTGKEPLAAAKDGLRRFKAHYETGEIPRSDGAPGGESVAAQPKQRPAQPLEATELEEAGV